MSFLELAFEGDCNHFENPEFEEIACRNCNEDPKTRQKIVQELRSMIIRRGQCHPRRLDDAYLLKFLRCRRFIPALAHRLMVRYEDFRKCYPSLYDCDVFKLRNEVYLGTYPESPVHGRLIIIRLGAWDLHELPDVMRAGLFFSELGVQLPSERGQGTVDQFIQESALGIRLGIPRGLGLNWATHWILAAAEFWIQVLGATALLDFKNLSLGHLSKFTPTIAHQFISMLGANFPVLTHSIHLVNYNWLLSSFFFICKQFIPKGTENIIHFHGSDMSSLHKYIDPASLPEEYGGTSKCVVPFNYWLPRVEKYIKRNDYLVQDFRDMGYII